MAFNKTSGRCLEQDFKRYIFNEVDLLAAKPISHRLPVKSLLELLLNGAGSEKSLIHTLHPTLKLV